MDPRRLDAAPGAVGTTTGSAVCAVADAVAASGAGSAVSTTASPSGIARPRTDNTSRRLDGAIALDRRRSDLRDRRHERSGRNRLRLG